MIRVLFKKNHEKLSVILVLNSIQIQNEARAVNPHIQKVEIPLHLFNVFRMCILLTMNISCVKTSRKFYEHLPTYCYIFIHTFLTLLQGGNLYSNNNTKQSVLRVSC